MANGRTNGPGGGVPPIKITRGPRNEVQLPPRKAHRGKFLALRAILSDFYRSGVWGSGKAPFGAVLMVFRLFVCWYDH